MTFIKTIPPGRARGETREVYYYMAEVAGHEKVAKIVQVFSLRKKMGAAGKKVETVRGIGYRFNDSE